MAMLQHNQFVRDDVMPSWWANAIQRFLSVGDANVKLVRATSTTVGVTAGPGQDAAIITIEGKWRWNEAAITRAVAGVAGTYSVWAVTAANTIGAAPLPGTDNTNYSWDVRVTAGPAPALQAGVIDHVRKIGDVIWDGVAITSVQPLIGAVGGASGDLTGDYPSPTVGPFPASRVLSWGGDTNLYRTSANKLKSDDEFEAADLASGANVYVDRAGGGGRLYLGPGLDTSIYRAGAQSLRTPGSLRIDSALQVDGNVGYFGATPGAKRTGYGAGAPVGAYAALGATSSLDDVIAAMTKFIADLRDGYGLIGS